TREEVGLDLAGAELLGRLDDLQGGNALRGPLVLSAFVYRLAARPLLVAQNDEVQATLWVPLGMFFDPARPVGPTWGGFKMPGVPVAEPGRPLAWGPTYRLLASLFPPPARPPSPARPAPPSPAGRPLAPPTTPPPPPPRAGGGGPPPPVCPISPPSRDGVPGRSYLQANLVPFSTHCGAANTRPPHQPASPTLCSAPRTTATPSGPVGTANVESFVFAWTVMPRPEPRRSLMRRRTRPLVGVVHVGGAMNPEAFRYVVPFQPSRRPVHAGALTGGGGGAPGWAVKASSGTTPLATSATRS